MSASIANDDSVTMICPNLDCQRTVCAPQSARGQVVRCAYCEAPFRVPAGKAAAPESNAAAPSSPAGKKR